MRQAGDCVCFTCAMSSARQAAVFALSCAAVGWLSASGLAAPPKVPGLPPQAFEYVKYALQDLPEHFKNGEVAALDNTPADNLLSDAGATLGRVLFYDTRLSHDGARRVRRATGRRTGFPIRISSARASMAS